MLGPHSPRRTSIRSPGMPHRAHLFLIGASRKVLCRSEGSWARAMQGELWGAKARIAEIQGALDPFEQHLAAPRGSRLILSTFPGVLVRKLRPLLLLLACTAAGATYAAAPDPSRCGALFDAYDSAVWLYPTPRFNGRTHSLIPPADVDRAGRQLRLNRCLTSSAALDGCLPWQSACPRTSSPTAAGLFGPSPFISAS